MNQQQPQNLYLIGFCGYFCFMEKFMKKIVITLLLNLLFVLSNYPQITELSSINDYVRESSKFINQGKHPEAIELLTKGIEKFPNETSLYIRRAQYYQWIKKGQLMEKDLDKAVEVADDKNKYNVLIQAAGVFMNSRECSRALELLNEAVALNSSHWNAYFNRSSVHSCLGDNAQALNDINYVLSIDPDNSLAKSVRNKMTTKLGGNKPDSQTNANLINSLEIKLKSSPNNHKLKYELAMIYVSRAVAFKKEKKFDEMFKAYDRAIEINPISQYYTFRGWQHFKHKNYEKSIADYTKAIELENPISASHYINRANLYFLTEQYENSLKDYEKVLTLDNQSQEFIKEKIEEIKLKLQKR
jgi:tetratricopeptide (TPR) repeat protein